MLKGACVALMLELVQNHFQELKPFNKTLRTQTSLESINKKGINPKANSSLIGSFYLTEVLISSPLSKQLKRSPYQRSVTCLFELSRST